KKVWASGGGENVVHVLDVTPGGLVETRRIPAGSFPAGIALGNTPLGDRLYVANNLGGAPFTVGPYEDPPGHQVTVIDPPARPAPRSRPRPPRRTRSHTRSSWASHSTPTA